VSLSDIYDRDGNQISWKQWARLAESDYYRRVGYTEIGPYVVSTVWLGLDHSFGHGPPIIFETAVFSKAEWDADRSEDVVDPVLLDLDARRYATLAEAARGHDEMCLLVEATTQVAEPHPDE